MHKPRINLAAIRGFEAAARRLSFTEAAAELHVTQGAVSRQIAALEAQLGQPLFQRMTRRIALTEAGRKLYEAVGAALDALDRSVDELAGMARPRAITVSILPTLGSLWLMPRLHKFTLAHPGVEVRVVTSIEPVDFRARAVDVAVRVGPAPNRAYDPLAPRIDLRMVASWDDVDAVELFPDVLVPVVAREAKPLADDELLRTLPLIHTSTRRHAWPDWLRAHDLPVRAGENAAEFGHFFMGLEEARAGRGVALAPSAVLPDIGDRRRLRILKDFAPTPSAGEYYALCSRSAADAGVKSFVAWLRAEAELHKRRMKTLA